MATGGLGSTFRWSQGFSEVIDTVKIQSVAISEDLAGEIERQLIRKSAVDMLSGEILYELYSGEVRDEHSVAAHHGVNVRIMRTRIVKDLDRSTPYAPRTKTVKCDPYLWLEGSIHKAMLGHNVWGGPRDLWSAVSWLISDVSKRLEVELPIWRHWDLMRADWAEIYDLGSFDNCQDYIRSLNSCRFPRREPQRYGDNSISFPGRTTAVRIYHKGPEFSGETFKRLSGILPAGEVRELAERAHRTLRVEVSVKRPKITEYHPLNSKVPCVETKWLREIHEKEVKKVIREANSDLTIVRDSQSVLARLKTVYAGRDRLVRSLFATWVQLAGLGENTVKANMKEWLFYDHRRKLIDAGIAWTGSDVLMGEDRNILPRNFVPLPHDVRCCSSEHPEVRRMLCEHPKFVA